MDVHIDRLRQLRSQAFAPTSVEPAQTHFDSFSHKEFDDGSLAERFHENTKHTDVRGFTLGPSAAMFTEDPSLEYAQARLEPEYGDRELLSLPDPGSLDRSLDATLANRRSQRAHAGTGISRQELSTLLGRTAGVTEERPLTDDEREESKSFRAYASAGGLYPIESYLAVINDGPDLEAGLYYYVPEKHALRVLERDEETRERIPELFSLSTDVYDPRDSAIALFLTGALWRVMAKYGPRGYRFVLQESGHLCQNVLLAAAAMDLAAVPLAGFYDDAVNEYLDVNGVDETAVYAIGIGDPAGGEQA
jgi:SagB-type dehydrogenase family enzyme